jgi:hypothetical protein
MKKTVHINYKGETSNPIIINEVTKIERVTKEYTNFEGETITGELLIITGIAEDLKDFGIISHEYPANEYEITKEEVIEIKTTTVKETITNTYFDNKIITGINEVYITNYGWMTFKEYNNKRKELTEEGHKDDYKTRNDFINAITRYNVQYKELTVHSDGQKSITEGQTDITKEEYDKMERRDYIIRRDKGHYYKSGRPDREYVNTVYLRGTKKALRNAMEILRLTIGEEKGKLHFSTSW